jgi:hypothetical protein
LPFIWAKTASNDVTPKTVILYFDPALLLTCLKLQTAVQGVTSQGKEIAGCHKNVNVYSSYSVAFEMMMRIFVISANGGTLGSTKMSVFVCNVIRNVTTFLFSICGEIFLFPIDAWLSSVILRRYKQQY